MTNTPNTPTVASNSPSNVVTPQTGSEVAVPPPAVVTSGTSQGASQGAPQGAGEPTALSVSNAVDTFESASEPAITALTNALPAEPPKTGKRITLVPARRLRAIPLLSQLLVKYPNLSADYTADDIDTPMADATACLSVGKTLTNLNARVTSTARVKQGTAWTVADEVYALAERKAKGDPNLARDLAPIQAILANGPRTETAPVTAAKTQTQATKATARATKANQKATAATAKAAAVKTGDATITQPAAAGTPAITIR